MWHAGTHTALLTRHSELYGGLGDERLCASVFVPCAVVNPAAPTLTFNLMAPKSFKEDALYVAPLCFVCLDFHGDHASGSNHASLAFACSQLCVAIQGFANLHAHDAPSGSSGLLWMHPLPLVAKVHEARRLVRCSSSHAARRLPTDTSIMLHYHNRTPATCVWAC